jgi:Fe-S cluster assembly iron-binding protein IscA
VKIEEKLPFIISEAACQKIIEIRHQKGIASDYYLRLGVKSAGCGVMSYVIGFDHKTEKDVAYSLPDFDIIIEKIQVLHLAGKIVDFDEVEGEKGFVFREKG